MRGEMFVSKKIVWLILTAFLLNAACASLAFGQQTALASEKDLEHAEKIRQTIHKTGAGLEKQITLKLKDNTEVIGFISEVADDHFIVKTLNSVPASLRYDQVDKVKVQNVSKNRRDFTTSGSVFKKVSAGIAIGFGVALIACIASRRCTD
jgi:hypothetical protein